MKRSTRKKLADMVAGKTALVSRGELQAILDSDARQRAEIRDLQARLRDREAKGARLAQAVASLANAFNKSATVTRHALAEALEAAEDWNR